MQKHTMHEAASELSWLKEETRLLRAEVERLRDHERQLTHRLEGRVLAALQERNDWQLKAEALEAQVKRLIAKEGERMSDQLRRGR